MDYKDTIHTAHCQSEEEGNTKALLYKVVLSIHFYQVFIGSLFSITGALLMEEITGALHTSSTEYITVISPHNMPQKS